MTIPPAAPELTPVEARSGLDPWVRAELPIPPAPRGLGLGGDCRPRGDRARPLDRQRRVSARAGDVRSPRPHPAVGDRRRGPPPDDLQHRGHALHGGHRGAGLHRLHAHAAVCHRLGLGIRRSLLPPDRLAGVGRQRRRRDLFPLRPSSRRTRGCHGGLQHRGGDVPRVRGCPPRWSADRADARSAQLGAHRVHPGQLPRAGRPVRAAPQTGSRARRDSSASKWRAARFDFLPRGTDFFLLAALVAYSGAGGVGNLTLSNWARDKGYGMGKRVGYIPAAAAGGRRCISRTAASSSRLTRMRCVGGGGGGGSFESISGACSSPAPSSAWRCPRCST